MNNGYKKIEFISGKFVTSDRIIIPYIEGDGIGVDITPATINVLNRAVERAYGGRRAIMWKEIYAGEKAEKKFGVVLPDETVEEIKRHRIALKGPLTTPVAGGIRSINVTIRQKLDLYVCLRPVKWIEGVPSPVKRPDLVNMVVFRENTEDIYSGIEWPAGSVEVQKVIEFLEREMKVKIPSSEFCGIGIKSISKFRTERLIRAAIRYAKENGLPSVTLVHKGNIMKYTEGAFKEWGYELVRKELNDIAVVMGDVEDPFSTGKVVVKDVLTDAFFQQILTRPSEYSVIATMNLNGDYISDALAVCVGGIGIAPGANINYEQGIGVFEATHGSAPRYAGLDKANPSSLILSGEMMLRYIGWYEAADLVMKGLSASIKKGIVTYDLARLMEGVKEVRCSEFAEEICNNIC